jgi:hypothetical protein
MAPLAATIAALYESDLAAHGVRHLIGSVSQSAINVVVSYVRGNRRSSVERERPHRGAASADRINAVWRRARIEICAYCDNATACSGITDRALTRSAVAFGCDDDDSREGRVVTCD